MAKIDRPFTARQSAAMLYFISALNGFAFAITGNGECLICYLFTGIVASWWLTYGRALER